MLRATAVLGTLGLLLGTVLYGSASPRLTLVAASEQEPPAESTRMVIAELFTSEGCSSCPPADDVLSRLVNDQPVTAVTVLALGEHVDYWDRLGWRDPFSSARFSERQSAYDAVVFRSGRIYTPQIVIDGQHEVIGSDEPAVHAAVRQAAKAPKAQVTVTPEAQPDGTLRVSIRIDAPANLGLSGPAAVMVAVTEDRLSTSVRRGENGGRVLKHAAVVRSLASIGQFLLDDRVHATTAPLIMAPEWERDRLRVVAFVQEQSTHRIVGAGWHPVR